MKKRKLNTNVLAVFVVAVSVLLFAAAFSIAPYWNDQKLTDNSIDINKIIADLEKLAANDANIAQFVELVKISKNNGELASYFMAPGATPTPTPSSGSCIFSNIQKDQVCEIISSYGFGIQLPCDYCMACNKQISIQTNLYYPYTIKVCDYITGTDAKKCDNNCLSGIAIPSQYGNERKCVKIVKSDPKISTCGNFCIDSTGCGVCQACVKDLITGLGDCRPITIDDNSGHGDPNDGGYKGAGCSGYYKEGKLVTKIYTCKNGNCEEK